MPVWLRLVLTATVCTVTVCAQPEPAAAARRWTEGNQRLVLSEFLQLLSIPNTTGDTAGLRRNAEFIAQMFSRRGVRTQLLESKQAPPVVYGEMLNPGAAETLVFYAHYDGQPVEPSQWTTGDPFRPVLMSGPVESGGRPIPLPRPGWPSDPEWRLYARSASDDKGPIMALASALDALRTARIRPRHNIKFFFEGEEESGSRNLARTLVQHREKLQAEVWLICDGPVHQNRQPQIVFGARGITSLELTVYGPRRELHSGHYGNWAPNPAMLLAQLLASMKDADGKVLIRGFYDGVMPLTEVEKSALAAAPDFDAALKRELWLAQTEGGGRRLEELINLPSLNVRGLASAHVGARSRNVIPSSAAASIDIRLVAGMDHRQTVERVVDHIRRQGFFVTETEPDEATRLAHAKVCHVARERGYNAVRTPMDLEISRRVIRALERAHGEMIKLPTLGGSVPIQSITEVLKTHAILVPTVNHDNNQHSFNENLRLQNLWDGIVTMAALLAME